MEYQRKKTPNSTNTLFQSAAVALQETDTLALQRRRQAQTLQTFTARPVGVQRQVASPVLSAIALQRAEEQRLDAERQPLQRQATELSASLPEHAISSALQRQAEQRQPIQPPARPQSAGDWVTVMRSFAQTNEQKNAGYGLHPREAAQHTALQRQVAQALAQQVKTSPLPAVQRYAEFAGHAVTLQRHPLTSAIPRVALNFVNVSERPALQRAVDDALHADALQRQQDEQALHLHSLQRQLAELDEQSTQPVMQRIQERRGAGNPLPAAIQRHLEQGLNHDLSGVRIHDDSEADKLSKSVNATAFTTGTDIYFRSGKFNPNTQSGLELLAHEVTHTVQQSQGKVGAGIDPDSGLEAEARAMGGRLANVSATQHKPQLRRPITVQRSSTIQRNTSTSGNAAKVPAWKKVPLTYDVQKKIVKTEGFKLLSDDERYILLNYIGGNDPYVSVPARKDLEEKIKNKSIDLTKATGLRKILNNQPSQQYVLDPQPGTFDKNRAKYTISKPTYVKGHHYISKIANARKYVVTRRVQVASAHL